MANKVVYSVNLTAKTSFQLASRNSTWEVVERISSTRIFPSCFFKQNRPTRRGVSEVLWTDYHFSQKCVFFDLQTQSAKSH